MTCSLPALSQTFIQPSTPAESLLTNKQAEAHFNLCQFFRLLPGEISNPLRHLSFGRKPAFQ